MQDTRGRVRAAWQRFRDDSEALRPYAEPLGGWLFVLVIWTWVAVTVDDNAAELPWIDWVEPTVFLGAPVAWAFVAGRQAARKGPWETSRQAGVTAGRVMALGSFLCGAALLGLGLLVSTWNEWLRVSLLNPDGWSLWRQPDTLLPAIGLVVGFPLAMGCLTYLGALTVRARPDSEAPSSQ